MSKKVVLLDYGSGNIRSGERALQRVGADVTVTSDFDQALNADGLLVPGVGAFEACMTGLKAVRGDVLVDRRLTGGRPVLGICVGMQILFARGIEHGVETEGCEQWPGTVERLQPVNGGVGRGGAEGRALPVPHMGWNTIDVPAGTTLFDGIEKERFYFVHSYGVREWELKGARESVAPLVTWTTYGADRFVAAVENGPLSATQFHPEKSGDAGAALLSNWVRSL
ncbi:glutamine amidotransferase [Kribbella steppae]|uniref:Imidazole glycerol phosphate synthase subunit HisH n=1 Tax=Kribbella steppae TaxID=2512223 RepID=A0A4R2H9B4_9ACTN|nr:imidazole glycerol phosphate synthase subunit HisH [Kribbella steppae]TCO23528.1 glutamine amidotransferase [Kribbella steppae]